MFLILNTRYISQCSRQTFSQDSDGVANGGRLHIKQGRDIIMFTQRMMKRRREGDRGKEIEGRR